MRQRITFFHRNEHGIEPTSLEVGDRSISGPDLVVAREHRVTLAVEELPAELQELLRSSNELYIRWSTPRALESLGPWTSRLPPGLHAFYTPQKGEVLESLRLCTQLRTVFGDIDCSSPAESFTTLPNDRFSHSTAYQYFHTLKSLSNFTTYVEQYACVPKEKCKERVEELANAVSLDLSYDAISHVVKITAVWPEAHQTLSINSHPDHRTEVGILTPDTPPHLEPHELGVTGLLTVLGEDTKPSPVLFSFPARHKDTESSFSSTFLKPWGLHPTMQLHIDSSKPPSDDVRCSLHAYLTLPRFIFADKYQLNDELFLSSKNLTALRYMTQPVDLEAPDYAMKLWGSSVLLELQPPAGQDAEPWTAEIPLHLRYMSPAAGGYTNIDVPSPAVFWACTAEDGTQFPNSPFDRVNLGYDGLFGPRTSFWHVKPAPEGDGSLMHQIRVPVLDLDMSKWISTGTSAVVLLGFAFVVFKLLSVYLKTGYGSQKSAKETQKKKQ
ncbi:Uu.00g058430.m01.CDS01 [Anthostomella pinea]|uniref:Protein PBN1 n=1 Tax=Anthostomella pinea TaxID=933095 RepID=A0AAI8VSQ5_9PEZI|nr:Uu.00g058430.m01.CDS01 [Anthostomella pinea]